MLLLLSFARIDFGQQQFFLVSHNQISLGKVNAVCKCIFSYLCVFSTSICVFYKLHSPSDSVCMWELVSVYNKMKSTKKNILINFLLIYIYLKKLLHFSPNPTQTHFNFISAIVLQTQPKETESIETCLDLWGWWLGANGKTVITIVSRLQVNQRQQQQSNSIADSSSNNSVKNISKTSKKKTMQTFLAIKWLRVWIKNWEEDSESYTNETS